MIELLIREIKTLAESRFCTDEFINVEVDIKNNNLDVSIMNLFEKNITIGAVLEFYRDLLAKYEVGKFEDIKLDTSYENCLTLVFSIRF